MQTNQAKHLPTNGICSRPNDTLHALVPLQHQSI